MIVRPIACLALLLPTLTLPAQATQWQAMREVVFDSTTFTSTGSTEDRQITKTLWTKELSAPRIGANGKQLPAFALLGDARTPAGTRVVFSMFAAAGSSLCTDAPNGAGATDIYSVCTMRVTAWPDYSIGFFNLPGYCMLYANPDREKNRVEYSVEPSQTGLKVRFRALQYGNPVAACSRVMQLG